MRPFNLHTGKEKNPIAAVLDVRDGNWTGDRASKLVDTELRLSRQIGEAFYIQNAVTQEYFARESGSGSVWSFGAVVNSRRLLIQ